MAAALLACDWGTTNLRAWTMDETGAVIASESFPLGVGRLQPGEAARRFETEVRPAMGAQDSPAVLCGMIGSNLGWRMVPYLEAPVELHALARGVARISERAVIVPGVRCEGLAGTPDVMRGEETQVLGWLQLEPARQEGRRLICHPGTHTKWVVVEDGRLVRFVTMMTGELFAVLSKHSVLRTETAADDPGAFDRGCLAAGEGDALAARLFTARTRVVAQGEPPESAASYLSGLLIGADVAAAPRLLGLENMPVALLGDVSLCARYERALARRGVEVSVHDGETAALAGLLAIHRLGGGE